MISILDVADPITRASFGIGYVIGIIVVLVVVIVGVCKIVSAVKRNKEAANEMGEVSVASAKTEDEDK